MNLKHIKDLLEDHGLRPDPKHVAAVASAVTALLTATSERFSKLPLEAEPSAFQAEQRRPAP
jgi:hypothetical protein